MKRIIVLILAMFIVFILNSCQPAQSDRRIAGSNSTPTESKEVEEVEILSIAKYRIGDTSMSTYWITEIEIDGCRWYMYEGHSSAGNMIHKPTCPNDGHTVNEPKTQY